MVYRKSAVMQCIYLMYEEGSIVRGLIATPAIDHIMFREPPRREENPVVYHYCSGVFLLPIVEIKDAWGYK